ncbi:MAG: FkbM family methyltransferase [Jaaginema sp. PMC 1079.18]|nr:FkbM family methyltransferase [Jaaginema sp. PMC 1080.18]MEC4850298.1 FkbM family methyltransferase [Jaaginema sp. PMC 1079.18]MEC4865868.1 FkbM family methyltransferase [Jaaginema sp. PMC 1078.18]
MALIDYLNRPEYWLRPQQVYRRLLNPRNQVLTSAQAVKLPWGVTISIYPDLTEVIERSLWVMGIYDLSLSEALWRAIAPGETVVDIGANIGYMTSLMAAKTGHSGRVIGFEPNPEVYQELQRNLESWQQQKNWPRTEVYSWALSSQVGEGILNIPLQNRGEAALVDSVVSVAGRSSATYTVQLTTLDRFWQEYSLNDDIAVLKIDVEGHELAVFEGAKNLLSQGRIRDIFFEDHAYYPSPATDFLEQQGYTIFRIWKGFWKPVLQPATYNAVHRWEPPNYVATLDSERLSKCFSSRGWQVFSCT